MDGDAICSREDMGMHLESILSRYDGSFLAHTDQTFVSGLLAKVRDESSDFSMRDYDKIILEKVVAHADNFLQHGTVMYESDGKLVTSSDLVKRIDDYMDSPELNKYIHPDDYGFLNSVKDNIGKEKRMSAKQIYWVGRVLEKADKRKANEDMGAIYFNPEGDPFMQKKGKYQEPLMDQAKRLLNFASSGKLNNDAISGEDVLRVRELCYDSQKGVVSLTARLMMKKNADDAAGNRVKSFDGYRRAINLLETYLKGIDPQMHESANGVNGLIYFQRKGLDVPFPNA